jgi:hypothetical protein
MFEPWTRVSLTLTAAATVVLQDWLMNAPEWSDEPAVRQAFADLLHALEIMAPTPTEETLRVARSALLKNSRPWATTPFKNGKMQGERIYFDVANMCRGAGVSVDDVMARARASRLG